MRCEVSMSVSRHREKPDVDFLSRRNFGPQSLWLQSQGLRAIENMERYRSQYGYDSHQTSWCQMYVCVTFINKSWPSKVTINNKKTSTGIIFYFMSVISPINEHRLLLIISSNGGEGCTDNWGTRIIQNIPYLLTPWSRVLSEKLRRPELLKKFPAFYGTRKFITAFTRARHLSLSWASWFQSMPPSNLSQVHFNIILPSTPGYIYIYTLYIYINTLYLYVCF
jgi:hypothetical protein